MATYLSHQPLYISETTQEEEFKQFKPQKCLLSKMIDLPPKITIIIDDAISLLSSDMTNITYLLNKNVHHKNVNLYIACHHVYNTKIMRIICYFNYIVVSVRPSNYPCWRVILRYFAVNKKYLTEFNEKAGAGPGLYALFNMQSSEVTFFKTCFNPFNKPGGGMGKLICPNVKNEKKFNKIYNYYFELLKSKIDDKFCVVNICKHPVKLVDLALMHVNKNLPEKNVILLYLKLKKQGWTVLPLL